MKHGTLKNGIKKIMIIADKKNEMTFYSDSFSDTVNDVITICKRGHCNGIHDVDNFYRNTLHFTAFCGDEVLSWSR